MNDQPRKTKPNWGSMASLIIFLVFVLGRPLANIARQLFNGSFSLPPISISALPWQGLLPLAIGGAALVLGAVIIGRILRVGDSSPRPPLGPPLPSPRLNASTPRPPGFEPLIHPLLLLIGILGLLGFGAIGFFLLLQGI